MRVLDCNGQGLSSGVIAGLDWLAQNAELPAVASLSLASPDTNLALEKALAAVIDLGITAVVPAGNLLQGASFVLLHSESALLHSCGKGVNGACSQVWSVPICSAAAQP